MKPTISVLMANYNNSRYIAEAIESVVNQSFEDWELIIIDDSSKDNSVEIIRRYVNNKKIKFLQRHKNEGYVSSLKKLSEEASADIFLILDSDDALTNDALELVAKTYKDHPDCGFVYSQFIFCDQKMNRIKNGYSQAIPAGRSSLQGDCVWALRSYRKECYYKTEGYNSDMLYAEDKDIIYKNEEVTKLFFIDKVLYKYRRLPDSQTSNRSRLEISRASHALARYQAFLRRQNTAIPNLTKYQASYELLDALPSCFKVKNYKRAKIFFVAAFTTAPLNIRGYLMLFARLIKFPFYRIYKNIFRKEDPLYGA